MSRSQKSPRPTSHFPLAVICMVGVFLLGLGLFLAREKRLEVQQKQAQLAAEEARLADLKQARDRLHAWKTALESDALAVEAAIRRKLHWVRPGERVLTWKPGEPSADAEGPMDLEG